MTEPIRITLMRHGPTAWNADKRIQGQTDIPLSPRGEDMALEWAEPLFRRGFDRIISSDLQRAVRTAKLVNRTLHRPLDMDDRLREQDWGEWTGKRIRDLRRDDPKSVEEQEARGWRFRPPGGEERTAVLGRVLGALEHLASRCPGERLLIVTHQGVLKCLLHRLLDMRFVPEEGDPLEKYTLHTVSLDPAAMAVPNAEPGAGLTLVRLNEEF